MKTREEIEKCVANLKRIAAETTADQAIAEANRGDLVTEVDWQNFRSAVESLTPEAVGFQSGAFSIERLAAIYPSKEIWLHWAVRAAEANEKARKEAWIASTVRVLSRSPKGLKESRLRPEDLTLWIKPGCIVVEHDTITRDHRREDDISMGVGKITYVAYPNGSELELGTVKDMRVVGYKTQYLLKPRGRTAEAKYQHALKEIADLEAKHHEMMMADAYSAAREIGRQIESIKTAANIPLRYIAAVTQFVPATVA